ncbi:MAG: ATPase domain-containing protein [Nitrososphaerota archaeon]
MISTGIPGVDELIGGLPRGELVIIAGGPGTGKTMFSAGFIYWGAAKYGEKGVYVSLAEDKETFITNMRRVGYDFRSLEDRGLFHFIDALTLMEAGTAELLEAIIEDVVSFGPQRLVIDSLSALAQGMREPRELRVFLHSLLSKIMRGLGCTTILIEEVPVGEARIGYGFEEFVASAVIILEKDMVDDKFLRRMRIEKLRGMPVPNNRACYTLGAGFIAFPPYKTPVLESPKTPEPVPDPPGRYSSGIRDLDGIMGGYPKGSTILLEIDPRITRDQYRMLIWPHIANFLLNRRPAITVPGIGSSPRDIEAFYRSYAIPEEERALARHLIVSEAAGRSPPDIIIPYDPDEGAASLVDRIEEAAEDLMERAGSPPIIAISMDSLEFNYGHDDSLKITSSIAAWTRRNNGLSLLSDKSTHPELTRRVAPTSSVHLRLTRRHGCLLLYGVKPRTNLFAVKVETEKGYYETRLIPIT